MNADSSRGRVFFVSEIYYPDETSTGYIFARLAESLARDREVHVLCGYPRYDKRGASAPERETHNGVAIQRCAGTTFSKDSLLGRLINSAAITSSLGRATARATRAGDVVIVATNPPTLPFSVVRGARRRGAKALLIVHDVIPETLIAAGILRRHSAAARGLAALHQRLYRKLDGIAVLGRDMAELVRGRFTAGSTPKLAIVRNWADLDLIDPTARATNPVLERLGLSEKFVVQYAGNMGRLHDIPTLLEAAAKLAASDPSVHFLFVGDGSRRPWLEQEVARRKLGNMSFVPRFPREEQPDYLNACDVAITAFVQGMYGASVPSRMYNVMAAAKPWIAAVERGSELGLVVTEERAGWIVEPGSVSGIVAAIVEAKANPGELRAKGERARAAAETKYSFASARQSLSELVDELATGRVENE